MLKSRSGHTANAAANTPPSIETVRRRARHRLIGASVLVLAGVVGFSLLFDTQPRPISVDIPIEIPTRAAVPSAPAPVAAAVAPTPPASGPASSGAQETLDEKEELVTEPARAASVAPAPAPASASAPTAGKQPPAGTPRPSDDGNRAQALLEGRTASAPPSPSPQPTAAAPVRLVVQVGAFAENARAQEVRMRLERAGLKTYTHVADTPEGRRIRVRVGPFDSRQEAERAAERVKSLNLPARILTL